MNLIEYVSGYHHGTKKVYGGNRNANCQRACEKHGQAYFDWFDETFGLEEI